MAKRGPRKTKTRYLVLYSPFLMKETKHELIGEPMTDENGKRRQWARCTKSRHTQLVELDALPLEEQEEKIIRVTREEARPYNPREEYSVDDVIYHQAWDDVGVVRSKEVTSNGGFAIVVQFEKNKEKRLLERFAK